MDLLRPRRESIEASGDAVVEARSDVDHHVAVMHRVVGLESAMHAQHTEPLRVGCRIGTQAEERRGDRIAGEADEFAEQRRRARAGIHHAAAGVEDRALGFGDQVDRSANGRRIALGARVIGLVLDMLGAGIGAGRELDVLGDIDEHRSGPAVGGNVEGLVDDAREIVHVADQPVVLGRRPRDADRVAFLEGVVADEMGGHLTGQTDDRDRVHQRVGERRHHVGRARAGGDQRDADAAGRAGIAFGGMAGALLMAHQDVLDGVLLHQLVIDREHRAAGIAENMLDALVDQRLDDDLRTCHLPVHLSLHSAPGRCLCPTQAPFPAIKKGPRGP